MIPACGRRSDRRSDGRTESIIAKTALCIASYADPLSKRTSGVSLGSMHGGGADSQEFPGSPKLNF